MAGADTERMNDVLVQPVRLTLTLRILRDGANQKRPWTMSGLWFALCEVCIKIAQSSIVGSRAGLCMHLHEGAVLDAVKSEAHIRDVSDGVGPWLAPPSILKAAGDNASRSHRISFTDQ